MPCSFYHYIYRVLCVRVGACPSTKCFVLKVWVIASLCWIYVCVCLRVFVCIDVWLDETMYYFVDRSNIHIYMMDMYEYIYILFYCVRTQDIMKSASNTLTIIILRLPTRWVIATFHNSSTPPQHGLPAPSTILLDQHLTVAVTSHCCYSRSAPYGSRHLPLLSF